MISSSAFIGSHHNAGAVDIQVRSTQRGDHAVPSTIGGPQINKDNLVGFMIDDIAKLGAAAHQVFRGKLAFENRILQMISEAPQFLMNASEPFIVRNVVTDKICRSHSP